jgi:2-C-methyl-D-erythritol 4-phosphate cytidylyltransferase
VVAVVPLPAPAEAVPQLRLTVAGATVLHWTLAALAGAPEVREIVLPHGGPLPSELRREVEEPRLGARVRLVESDTGRMAALRGALELTAGGDRLLVLDANRPLLSCSSIAALVRLGEVHDALVAALPVKSTFKQVRDGRVLTTVPRERLVHLQRPTLFRRSVLEAAVRRSLDEGWDCPDEVVAARRAGVALRIVTGDLLNIPITTSADVDFVRLAITRRLLPADVPLVATGRGVARPW